MGNSGSFHHASALAAAFGLTACASSVMGGFVGQPVQNAVVKYGQPASAFDMGDGRRAFQWVIESSFTTPTTVRSTGIATPIGGSVLWTQNTQITGGQPVTSKCAYTMFGRWNGSAWVIEGFQKPPLSCE